MLKKIILKHLVLLIGLTLPWIIAPLVFWADDTPPTATIALLYLTIVVIISIKFPLLTSIATATSSFFAFTVFFAENYQSIKIQREEDFFTALFFLLTAFVVGHLSYRHNKNEQEIRLREKLSYIEIHLLDELTQALNQDEVLKALDTALTELSADCQLIRFDSNNTIRITNTTNEDVVITEKALTKKFHKKIPQWEEQNNIYVLHDKNNIVAALDMSSAQLPSLAQDAFRLLMHQANIALERSRLIADLAREKIEKENESLRSALLSSISHDFRTPLTTMIGATSTVLEMGEHLAQSQVKELLETVVTEAERLNRYTQNLLDMTRLGLGQLRLERHWIEMDEIVNSLHKRVKPLLQDVGLIINIEPNLPLLFVHAALIEQALFNLLDNAIKFSPKNTNILLACRREQKNIIIVISDAGMGIAESERIKVFERFYTAAQGDRRKSGSGLGLTICRGMFNAHGGQVTIHSNAEIWGNALPDFLPASGCCINIKLPISLDSP